MFVGPVRGKEGGQWKAAIRQRGKEGPGGAMGHIFLVPEEGQNSAGEVASSVT